MSRHLGAVKGWQGYMSDSNYSWPNNTSLTCHWLQKARCPAALLNVIRGILLVQCIVLRQVKLMPDLSQVKHYACDEKGVMVDMSDN